MDLINWSLNAIDTIRNLGFGEPDCPDGTFAAGYTMDAWERWRIVCLAPLSVEDIEDIYLFGTVITGRLQGEAHGFKGKIIIWRPKWTERVACKIGMRLLAPKTK